MKDESLPQKFPYFQYKLVTWVYSLARAAIRKYHRLGSSNNRHLFSHSSGGWKSTIKLPAGFGLFWGVSPWLVDGRLLIVSSQALSSVPVQPSISLCVYISSGYKKTSQTGLGPTLTASFQVDDLFKDSISKYRHILRYWALGLQHMNLGRTPFSLQHSLRRLENLEILDENLLAT